MPLPDLPGWVRRDGRLTHESDTSFAVVGARVEARGREVTQWCQPLVIEPATTILGLAVTEIDDVIHVLVEARSEPGLTSGAELGPTVQCTPGSFDDRTWSSPLLNLITHAPDDAVLFDSVLSGEGGRFFQATQRHVVVRTGALPEPPGFRWVAVHQLAELVARGQAVNEQARSLFVCLMSLLTPVRDGDA